ncbi:MAG: SMP-30/gluconolactonase/LRE family protein [Ruminococcaceae bacterium]|nr:SMP-30/gluconolactonase/LRE family protein [Oscillospiraceae bacterium]
MLLYHSKRRSGKMEILNQNRTIIGEGPVWNEKEQKLYYVNPYESEYRILDIYTKETKYIKTDIPVCAIAFSDKGDIIASQEDGVHILNSDGTRSPLYDKNKFDIKYCNDMKVGPDGKIYVGTQSEKRKTGSGNIDGKLYSIDNEGNVKVLLDNLILSNGLEWSLDEKFLYHTDSDTKTIKEYAFDKESGNIEFTGREIRLTAVDGFTVDKEGNLLVAAWGYGYLIIIDTKTLTVKGNIDVPAKIPASCGFAGSDMEKLITVTANFKDIAKEDKNAGYTFSHDHFAKGRKPFLFKTKEAK